MTIVSLRLDESECLDVSSVIASLRASFSGTEITENDSFDAERKRAIETIAKLEESGTPIKNPKMIFQSITNKEAALGPGVDVSICLGDSKLSGHIWAKDINLRSSTPLPDHVIESVKTFIESLGVGKIIVII